MFQDKVSDQEAEESSDGSSDEDDLFVNLNRQFYGDSDEESATDTEPYYLFNTS